jgi:hypothetical protein
MRQLCPQSAGLHTHYVALSSRGAGAAATAAAAAAQGSQDDSTSRTQIEQDAGSAGTSASAAAPAASSGAKPTGGSRGGLAFDPLASRRASRATAGSGAGSSIHPATAAAGSSDPGAGLQDVDALAVGLSKLLAELAQGKAQCSHAPCQRHLHILQSACLLL